MKGADAVAQILKKEGVDFIGCIPYNSLEEAAAVAGIRPLIFRQERVGVNLADGVMEGGDLSVDRLADNEVALSPCLCKALLRFVTVWGS